MNRLRRLPSVTKAAAEAAWNLFVRGEQHPSCKKIADELRKDEYGVNGLGVGKAYVKSILPQIKRRLEQDHPESPACLINERFYEKGTRRVQSLEEALTFYPRKVPSHGIYFVTDPNDFMWEASRLRNSETATGKERAELNREASTWQHGLLTDELLQQIVRGYTLGPILPGQLAQELEVLAKHNGFLGSVQEAIEELPQLVSRDDDEAA